MENDNVKICWDLNVYTGHVIKARQPAIVVVKKEMSECLLIDIAVPGNVQVERKKMIRLRSIEICAGSLENCGRFDALWGQ